ncbi:MAG TPA: EamA family transporter, partial [Opitutales bacterium]|nr:EamA family transporter [Opitutales bacterium]
MSIPANQPPASRVQIIAAFAAVYIFWGSTYLAIRVGVAAFPPFLFACCRYLLAGSLMFGWLAWRGVRRPNKRQWKEAAISGSLLLLGNGLVCWAEQTVNSSLAALILASSPIWFALFDTVRPGGRYPRWNTVLGILVGTGGVALLVFGKHDANGDATSLAGATALVLACAFWAAGSIYNKYHTSSHSPWMSTAAQMLCGGAANGLVGTLHGEWAHVQPAHFTAPPLIAFAYLVFFGAIVGFSAFVWLLAHCAPAKVATYAYVNPI